MSDFGEIKDYIVGAVVKRLTAVECDPSRSNGHEINAGKMKPYLGEGARSQIPTTFIRLDDDPDEMQTLDGSCSWWFRDRTSQGKGVEYRLYYQDNPAITEASINDVLAIILKPSGDLIFVTAPQASQSELELYELFGDQFNTKGFKGLDFRENHEEIGTVKRFILEELGVEVKANFGSSYLELISEKFGGLVFPKTKEFSALAREIAGDFSDFNTVDKAIIKWWDTEEAMFRQLEGALIDDKLSRGFEDAEDFLGFSQTIRQRRNSRAGSALENHLAHLFNEKGVKYSWEPKTENNKKPDFLFPSIDDYKNKSFPPDRLTMLGVKTTCKDRWRQVLTEADRIPEKHLFTLQPKISSNQTSEMMEARLQLVIPESIHSTYTNDQCKWLWDFETFIEHVAARQ